MNGMLDETDDRQNEKDVLGPRYILGKPDHNISSPYSLYFSKSKTSSSSLLSSLIRMGLANVPSE
jgi:hypothetical protein